MKIEEFTQQDFENLYANAKPIWYNTYSGIIPFKQFDFLTNKYFSLEGINYYKGLGYRYFKISEEKQIGFLVIKEYEEEVYLDKIYFDLSFQGKGYFKEIIKFIEKFNKPIILNVNQKNLHAIKAYQKNGFEIILEEVIQLPNNMVNIDYKMKRSIH